MLSAPSLENARAQLQEKGWRILQLKPPAGPNSTPQRQTTSAPSASPPQPNVDTPLPVAVERPAKALATPSARFSYQAVDAGGRQKDGLLLATSAEDARHQLEQRNLKVLVLKPLDGAVQVRATPESGPAPSAARALSPGRRPAPGAPSDLSSPRLSLRQLNLLAIQLSVMINAGLSYFRALSALTDAEDLAMAHVAHRLAQKIHDGLSLSKAMASLPGTFDNFFVRMVRVGETTGNMHQVMHLLTEALTRQEKQRSRVLGALAYPAFILIASGLMVAFLVYYMLPGYLTIFAQTGVDTPGITRALIWLSRSPLPLLTIALPLAALGGLWLTAPRLPLSRQALDWLRYHTPGIKHWFRKALLIRICRNLALMTSTGIGLVDGLQILTTPPTGYREMDAALMGACDSITAGASLADALAAQPAFPSFLVQAVASGEQVGKLPHFLEKWSDMLEEDLDYTIDSFIQLLEPMMLLAMGVLVGFIVLAAFMPVFTLMRTL